MWDGATVGSVQKQEFEHNDNIDHSIDKSSKILNLKIFLDFMEFSELCFFFRILALSRHFFSLKSISALNGFGPRPWLHEDQIESGFKAGHTGLSIQKLPGLEQGY